MYAVAVQVKCDLTVGGFNAVLRNLTKYVGGGKVKDSGDDKRQQGFQEDFEYFFH